MNLPELTKLRKIYKLSITRTWLNSDSMKIVRNEHKICIRYFEFSLQGIPRRCFNVFGYDNNTESFCFWIVFAAERFVMQISDFLLKYGEKYYCQNTKQVRIIAVTKLLSNTEYNCFGKVVCEQN